MNDHLDPHARHLATSAWRKSSYSNGGEACVEVADLPHGLAVRDSKDTAVPGFHVTGTAWTTFIQTVTTPRS